MSLPSEATLAVRRRAMKPNIGGSATRIRFRRKLASAKLGCR